jgi:hypothetical protein
VAVGSEREADAVAVTIGEAVAVGKAVGKADAPGLDGD